MVPASNKTCAKRNLPLPHPRISPRASLRSSKTMFIFRLYNPALCMTYPYMLTFMCSKAGCVPQGRRRQWSAANNRLLEALGYTLVFY